MGTYSLVKMTQAEVREIRDAAGTGLVDVYLDNGYVYYVDGSGADAEWTGFYGNLTTGAPYLTCPLHTEEYFKDIIPEGGEIWGEENNNQGGWGENTPGGNQDGGNSEAWDGADSW